jgi:AcrR family transcriptional regulator
VRITKSIPERRREIVSAARALFIENGFDETQVSDISKKMNVAQGLVYHYFKSKTELLYAVIDELTEEYRKTAETTLNGVNGTALEKLEILFNNHPVMDDFGKLIPSLIGDMAIGEYCFNKMTASKLLHLRSLIEQGNTDGSWNCEYPEETALFLLRGFCGFIEFARAPLIENEKRSALRNIITRILGPAQK